MISNPQNNIICIDNQCHNIEKLIEFEAYPNFTFEMKDILTLKHTEFSELDLIYNFACNASPKNYQKNPIHTIKTNTDGILNLCEIARQTDAQIVQSSTSEIYGNPLIHPQSEKYYGNVNPTGPRSCYDEGKRIAETIIYEYNKQYDLDTTIIRIFNTYGPYTINDDGRVIHNFINQALQKKPLTIYGDGTQTRSFLYISDFIYFLNKITYKKIKGPINIGNPEEVTIKELANTINKLLHNEGNIKYCPLPPDDPILRKPDVSKLYKELQMKSYQFTTLQQGINRILETLTKK